MDTNAIQSDLDNDFDHLDPAWVADPYPIWDAMRQTCPVAHTDKFNGVYFPSRYEDVRAIAYDTEHFSSRRAPSASCSPSAASIWAATSPCAACRSIAPTNISTA